MRGHNCNDCKHQDLWDDNPCGVYRSMCKNPKLIPLITSDVGSNKAVRCNETREFNFACGHDAKWFEPKEVAA